MPREVRLRTSSISSRTCSEGEFTIAQRHRLFTAADGYSQVDLLRFARYHLASAKVLWTRSFDCFDSAGVLCHLGLELLFKAVLLHSNGAFPATHDLAYLLRLLAKSPHALRLTQAQSALLVKIDGLFSLRYPEPNGSPEIGDEDVIRVEALVRDLVRQLPAELRLRFTSRGPCEKGGRILMRRPKAKA